MYTYDSDDSALSEAERYTIVNALYRAATAYEADARQLSLPQGKGAYDQLTRQAAEARALAVRVENAQRIDMDETPDDEEA